MGTKLPLSRVYTTRYVFWVEVTRLRVFTRKRVPLDFKEGIRLVHIIIKNMDQVASEIDLNSPNGIFRNRQLYCNDKGPVSFCDTNVCWIFS